MATSDNTTETLEPKSQPLLDEDFDESEWLKAASRNPVFAFLKDEEEEIYSAHGGIELDQK